MYDIPKPLNAEQRRAISGDKQRPTKVNVIVSVDGHTSHSLRGNAHRTHRDGVEVVEVFAPDPKATWKPDRHVFRLEDGQMVGRSTVSRESTQLGEEVRVEQRDDADLAW